MAKDVLPITSYTPLVGLRHNCSSGCNGNVCLILCEQGAQLAHCIWRRKQLVPPSLIHIQDCISGIPKVIPQSMCGIAS